MKPKAISVFDHLATPSSSNSAQSISDSNHLSAAIEWLMLRRLLMWFFLFCMVSVSLWAQGAGGPSQSTVATQKDYGTINGRAV